MNFADAICISEKLTSYEARCVAKAYIIGNAPEKALNAITKVKEEDVNHWLLYEKSKAYIELNRNNDALDCAEHCFKLVQSDIKAATRIAIYHDLLSKCHEALGDYEKAQKELAMAIDNCSNKKYTMELKDRLSALRNR